MVPKAKLVGLEKREKKDHQVPLDPMVQWDKLDPEEKEAVKVLPGLLA